jgi:hypothetical protein
MNKGGSIEIHPDTDSTYNHLFNGHRETLVSSLRTTVEEIQHAVGTFTVPFEEIIYRANTCQ